MRPQARGHMRDCAVWLSVMFTASVTGPSRRAFSAMTEGSALFGGPISLVMANRPSCSADSSRVGVFIGAAPYH